MVSIIQTCGLVGCSNPANKGYIACNRTHGRIYDSVKIALSQLQKDTIEFYDAPIFDKSGKQIGGGKYYELTNFFVNYRHGKIEPVKFAGAEWLTSEHAFQAAKFATSKTSAIYNAIMKAPNARTAFGIAQANVAFMLKDWMQIRDTVMYQIVKSKFSNNDHLKNVLLKTGNKKLVEASPVDVYWGYGPNKKGANVLGRILMRVRYEIANNI